MAGNSERVYDDYERMVSMAIMNRQAYHAKKLKPSDLFKRPTDEVKANKKAETRQVKTDAQIEWLSQFAEFSDKL